MTPAPAAGEPFYAIPTLMRAARGAYAQAIRAALEEIGTGDLPRNGAFVLSRISEAGSPRADVAMGLGVSKQALSQLVDVLVGRGYVTARVDVPGDRRRVGLTLTALGEEVLGAVVRSVQDVDRALEARVTPEKVQALREALAALVDLKAQGVESGKAVRRRERQLRSASAIFPVRDMGAAFDHYAALGFATQAHEAGDDYGFADREGVALHFIRTTEDPFPHAAAYLYVRDADALYEEWSRPGIGGRTFAPEPTDYRLKEGRHVDPDGNVLRFGSPLEAG